MKLTDHPPMSKTDKLCLVSLAGLLVAVVLTYELTDGRVIRAAETDKPPEPPAAVVQAHPIDCMPLVEAVEAAQEAQYDENIPLDRECQKALREACEANGVPLCLALGVIEVESGFRSDADNGVSVGLMQLNRKYFPNNLTPAENIRAGVECLGELLERYGDTQAALRAYNRGFDDGDRTYARAVLDASEKWERG